MRNATAARIVSPILEDARPERPERPERRAPAQPEEPESAARRCGFTLHWPMSWPAVLYVGEAARQCTVQAFSAAAAHLTMADPPPAGTEAVLKFPFTVHLKGEVAWSREGDLGLDFDATAQPSARIVEDVLLNQSSGC